MSRKDYEAVAEAVMGEVVATRTPDGLGAGDAAIVEAHETAIRIATRLATTFARSNPRFDPTLFLSACGLTHDEFVIYWGK